VTGPISYDYGDVRMKRKWIFSLLGAIALTLVMLLELQSANASPARSTNTNADTPTRAITVDGQATVLAKPDIASAEIGVQVTASSVSQATQQANSKMASVIAKLKELGIADQDIQTSNYSIFPQQNPQSAGAGETTAYQVVNSVRVTIHDLNKIGEILDQAVQAGANNISGITFSVADPEKLKEEALGQAIVNAQARADVLAEASNVRRGEVLTISAIPSPSPIPFAEAAAQSTVPGVPLQTGEIEVQVQVQVTYAIQ
jgi:uncharacterized protein YggE